MSLPLRSYFCKIRRAIEKIPKGKIHSSLLQATVRDEENTCVLVLCLTCLTSLKKRGCDKHSSLINPTIYEQEIFFQLLRFGCCFTCKYWVKHSSLFSSPWVIKKKLFMQCDLAATLHTNIKFGTHKHSSLFSYTFSKKEKLFYAITTWLFTFHRIITLIDSNNLAYFAFTLSEKENIIFAIVIRMLPYIQILYIQMQTL